MSRRTLLCCAYPFGYGPAAKLLHIVRELRGQTRGDAPGYPVAPLRGNSRAPKGRNLIARGIAPGDWQLIFLGTGIAHELASRSLLFDEVVPLGPDDPRVRVLLTQAAGMLSLMERDHAAAAVARGLPVFVADSLLWLRDRVPVVFQQARRYWAQEFVGVRSRLAEVGPRATVVGPIVGRRNAGRIANPSHRVVVNLGGVESPLGLSDPCYADFVCRVLLRCGSELPSPVLLAGSACIRALRARYPDCGLELISVAHEDALAKLWQARWVITAPGLTACLECFQAGVPTLFLPPQNYSQWWILKTLRSLGLAPGSFHWEDLLPGYPITERMPDAVRGPLVADAIHRLAGDGRAEQLLREGLGAALTSNPDELTRRATAFFESLGPDGTAQIANDLADMC